MNPVYIAIAAFVAVAGVIIALLLWRARKPAILPAPAAKGACCKDEPLPEPAPKRRSMRERITAVFDAIDYLRTRREWRYGMPWMLLLGEHGAGKSSTIGSVAKQNRLSDDVSATQKDELAIDGIEWHFFNQGAMIDPQGRLPAAAEGTAAARVWSSLLDELDALRPERALDGVVLAVSARSLRHATPEERRSLAENARRQLDTIQQRFEFMLPVYVVVTQTDAVDGFTAFWRAQSESSPEQHRLSEMFGWSAPATAADATPQEWADRAFDILGERLKFLQVDAAAECDHIDDADRFFLFPRHFQLLRTPLKDWLALVFEPSAWRAGFLCRGIYFTGSLAADGDIVDGVRNDVAFIDDLVTKKMLAEPHLARPTRNGIWSRNKLIRSLQVVGVTTFCSLLVALSIAGLRLNRQVDALVSSLKLLQATPTTVQSGESCIPKDRVYDLLAQVARIDADSMYWAIPVSWIDSHATRKSARMISEAAFQRVAMPGLACRLELRARELSAHIPKAPANRSNADAYKEARQALFDYLQSVQALETNLARFRTLSAYAPSSEKARMTREFIELTEYAYGSPVPAAVKNERGALSATLAEVKYNGTVQLPVGMQQRLSDQILQLSSDLRTQFKREVEAGNTLLNNLTHPLYEHAEQTPETSGAAIVDNTRHFTWWLTWVRKSWLGSTPQTNPCEDIRSDLATGINQLVSRYKYPTRLEQAGNRFGMDTCYKPSMETLTQMQLAPYGSLFTRQNGALQLNPELVPELNGLTALSGLNYMQVTAPRPFSCRGAMAGWRTIEVNQAAAFAREYQIFAKAQGLPASGANAAQQPLYDKLARQQLELAMSSVLRDAQIPVALDAALYASSGNTGLDASSLADQQLAQQSTAFAGTLDPFLGVLRIYGQYGFKSGAEITECARNFASDSLASVSALSTTSRLYAPDAGSDDAFFDLGSTAVIKDYLARQVARSQVLAGYATPFVNFLQNTKAVNDAQKTNDQTAPYWDNTITELNRYVQFKEPNGQVAQLDNLFLKQFPNLDASNCGKTLDATSAEYGNDMFSNRRRQLDEQVRWRCDDKRHAQAYATYRDLSQRFTRDLAGRYPFGDLSSRDASPATVKAFFADYDAQRAAARQILPMLSSSQRTAVQNFLDKLDAASAFFNGTLTATEPSQPLKLALTFHAQPNASRGADQIVSWNLTSNTRSAGFPNRTTTLDWPYGQPLVLDLAWANRSLVRPARDPKQTDLRIEGATASFSTSGDWALLRMIEAHRPNTGAAVDTLDPNRALLEFIVPVVPDKNPGGALPVDTARLYLGINFAAKDPKTQAPVVLAPPPVFPRYAPPYEELTWTRKSRN